MLLLWNKNKALWINQEKSKWSPYYQYHLSFQRWFIFTSFVLIDNSCTSRIWCLQINAWLWFDWRQLENILFIRYILSLASNLKKYQMFSVYFKYWYEKFARALTNSWYVQLYNKCRFHLIPGTTMYGNYVSMLQWLCTILCATWCCDVILYRCRWK